MTEAERVAEEWREYQKGNARFTWKLYKDTKRTHRQITANPGSNWLIFMNEKTGRLVSYPTKAAARGGCLPSQYGDLVHLAKISRQGRLDAVLFYAP